MKYYDECPYYKMKYTNEDIFGHDDYDEFCTKNNQEKKIIGFIQCQKCKEYEHTSKPEQLYLVHDKDYNYKIVASAKTPNDAISKVEQFLKETKQTGTYWHNPKWIASLFDNEKIL